MMETEAQVPHRLPQSLRKQRLPLPSTEVCKEGRHQGGTCGLDGVRAQEAGTNNPEIIKSETFRIFLQKMRQRNKKKRLLNIPTLCEKAKRMYECLMECGGGWGGLGF